MSKATFAFIFGKSRFISSLVNEELIYQATARFFPTLTFHEENSQFYFMDCFCKDDLEKYLKAMGRFIGKYSKVAHYIYLNAPLFHFVPYLLLARRQSKVPISFFIYVHSVGAANLLDWMMMAHLIQPCDLVVTPSNSARECLVKISAKYRQVKVLHLPIEKAAVKLERRNNIKNPVLTYMGRIEDYKNVHLLIEIFPEILKRFPQANLQIVGPPGGSFLQEDESSWYRYLKKEAGRRNLDSSVHFLGLVLDPLKKAEILKCSDLFLYPAVGFNETFGYTMLEALSFGLPVITTDWNGHREIIRDDYNGYLVSSGRVGEGMAGVDKEELSEKILDFLGGDRLRFRQNALESVDSFSYERYGELLSCFLKQSDCAYEPLSADIFDVPLGDIEGTLPFESDPFLSKTTLIGAALTLFMGRYNQKPNDLLQRHAMELNTRFLDDIYAHFYSKSE